MADDRELAEIRARLEKLESRMSFVLRRLGIGSEETPGWTASARVLELVARGDEKGAIKAFIDETGASLKDAKAFVQSLRT